MNASLNYRASAACIFAAAIALRVAVLGSPVHDYDEGVYWQSLLAMHDGYAQYHDIFVSQPPLFLDTAYAFFGAFGKTLYAARIVALLGSILNVACGSWIAYRISGRAGAILALVLLALNNIDLAESVTLQADALSVGLGTLSVALSVEGTGREKRAVAFAAAAGAAAAAALLVKLLVIACVLPFLTLVLWKRGLRALVAYGLAAVLVAIAGLAPHANTFHEMLAQTVLFHLNSDASFPVSRLSAIAAGFQAPLLLLALGGLVVAFLRKDLRALSIAAWLLGAFLTLLKITPVFPHHLEVVQAPLAVLASYAGVEIVKYARMPVAAGAVLCVIAVEGWFLTGAVHAIFHPSTPTLSGREFSRIVPKGGWVITDLQATAAIAGYRTPPDLVDTSMVRVRSGNLTSEQLIRDARDPRVTAVIFGGRRLSLPQLRAFSRWTRANFHRTASPLIWTRARSSLKNHKWSIYVPQHPSAVQLQPRATENEIRDASLQFVRKISGLRAFASERGSIQSRC